MAKRISQLTALAANQLAQDDYLVITDTSAGDTKRISVKDLTGLPDVGYIVTGESWAYSSYNSNTAFGVITVPTNATLKYSPGNFVRFVQNTGGTKYAQIISLTSTALTVHMKGGVALTNEAITSPVYSAQATPIGARFGAEGVDFGNGDGTGLWWEELVSFTQNSSSATMNPGSFPARRFLKIKLFGIYSGANLTSSNFQFNGDTAANYAFRLSSNGGSSDGLAANTNYVPTDPGASTTNVTHMEVEIANFNGYEKPIWGWVNDAGSATGPNSIPNRREISAKWSGTSQITSVLASVTGASGILYAPGSRISVLGHN